MVTTPPTRYIITLTVITTRQPREDPWPQLAKASDALFKVGGELDLIGATVEQITPGIPLMSGDILPTDEDHYTPIHRGPTYG